MITDPVFKVTENGISAPSYEEILSYFRGKAQDIFGTDINLDADTQDGQLVTIFAAALSDVNAQALAVCAAFNPQTASGVGLDGAVKTNGISRQVATASQTDLTLVGQAGTVIENGIAVDTAENRWVLPELVTIPLSGEVTVTAHAEEFGDLTAAAGAINRIGTPTRGWQTVTNKLAAIPGKPVETDTELRARQARSTALPSVSLWEGIIGNLLSLDGVLRVSGVRNDTDTVSTEGIPAHSVAMIVDGGDAQAIGKTIFMKKGEGTGTYGNLSVTYMDVYGFPNVVRFSRPTLVKVSVKLVITASPYYLSSVADEIKNRIVDYINSLKIGDGVGIARVLACAVKTDAGVDTRFTVDEIAMAKNSGTLSAASIPIAWNEAAACEFGGVTVEVRS